MPSVLLVTSFPPELLDHIVEMEKDDRSTLYNLCLVSRAFRFAAQRYLYRQVTLGGVRIQRKGCNRWNLNNIANNAFFSTLLQSQHLALHVRELYFKPDVGCGGGNPWKPFHQALHQMVNLKRLHLTLMTSDQSSSRILEALNDHPFELETFSWMDYRFKIAANEPEALVSFLLSQPRLQALDIVTEFIPLVLPEKSCPNLSTFIGTFAHALTVLRVCPITNFVWTVPHGSGLHPDMTILSQTLLSNLRVLVLHDHIPVELDSRAGLMSYFQSLEALHISITSNDGYQRRSAGFLDGTTKYLLDLPVLKSLRMIALTGILIDDWQRVLSDRYSFATTNAFITGFFDSHPSLERFYTNGPDASNHYRRWKRNEEYFTDVERDELEDFYRTLGFDSSLICRQVTYGRAIWV